MNIKVGDGTATRGGAIILPITTTSTAPTGLAGLQWTFVYVSSGDITSEAVTPGPTLATTSKVISSSSLTYLIYGVDTNTIADGTLAIATFTVNSHPLSQTITVSLSSLVAVDTAGTSIPITGTSGSIQLFNSNTTKDLLAKARIQLLTTHTLVGKASIQVVNTVTTHTIPGKSRIQLTTSQTVTGKASIINVVTTRTLTAKSRIGLSTSRTLLAKASITVSNTATTKTLVAKSRISASGTQTLTARATIATVTTQTIVAGARIGVNAPPSVIVMPEQIFVAF